MSPLELTDFIEAVLIYWLNIYLLIHLQSHIIYAIGFRAIMTYWISITYLKAGYPKHVKTKGHLQGEWETYKLSRLALI